ncbi:MAG: metal-dependent hydrolase [Candidatus Contendobacter sp.]
MTLPTHLAFASVLYLGGATLFGYRPDAISWALAAATSLLPDIDLPPARIGRLFWFVSVPLERRFGHRTLTHSPYKCRFFHVSPSSTGNDKMSGDMGRAGQGSGQPWPIGKG